MDGDLSRLESVVSDIESPLLQIMAFIELAGLRRTYGWPAPTEEELQVLGVRAPYWYSLISRKIFDGDAWKLQSNMEIKIMMDEDFPVSGYSAQDIFDGSRLVAGGEVDRSKFDLAALIHVRKFMSSDDFLLSEFTLAPNRNDYLDLLYSTSEANMLKDIDFQLGVQGRYQKALELLERYEIGYMGNPQFSLRRAQIVEKLIRRADSTLHEGLRREIRHNAKLAFFWSGGQTWTSFASKEHLGSFGGRDARTYAEDFPARWFWVIYAPSGESLAKLAKKDIPAGFSSLWGKEYALAYSHDQIYPLETLMASATEAGSFEELEQKYGHRFIGHPKRGLLKEGFLKKKDDVDGLLDLYLAALKEFPRNRDALLNYAELEISRGNFESANDVIWNYPPFTVLSPADNRVGISSDAYNIGLKFYLRGATEFAAPFFKIASDLNTGSAASLGSGTYLAIIDGRYFDAAEFAQASAYRYPDNPFPFYELMSLWHLDGRHEDAWSLFQQYAKRFKTPQLWTSVFVGHRKQGESIESLGEWLSQFNKVATNGWSYFFTTSSRYAVLQSIVDRRTKDISSLLRKLERASGSRHPLLHCEGRRINRPGAAQKVVPHEDLAKVPIRSSLDPEHVKLSCADIVLYPSQYMNSGHHHLMAGEYQKAFEIFLSYAQVNGLTWGGNVAMPALPYLAWSSFRSGKVNAVKTFIENVTGPSAIKFDKPLALALLHGGNGEHEEAVKLLIQAFNSRPHTDSRPVFTEYQLVEAAEWLFEYSGEERYRQLVLDWSRKFQRIYPWMAWAYAVEAKHTDDDKRQIRALGITLSLDPKSMHIEHFSEAAKAKARKWFSDHNPFALPMAEPAHDDQVA